VGGKGEDYSKMKIISDYVYRRTVRIGFTGALAAVLVAGSGLGSAAAQGRQYDSDRDDRYSDSQQGQSRGRRMSSADARRIAAINGYAEGYEHGARDRQGRSSFNYKNGDAYRRAGNGYDENFGSERDYQNVFRQGFAKGYSDAYYGRQRNRSYNNRGRGYNGRQRQNDQYNTNPGYGRNSNGNDGAYHNGRYYDDREGNLDRQEVTRRAAQQGYTDGFARGQYDNSIGARQPKPQGHGAYQTAFNGWNPEWGSARSFQQSYRQYFMQGYEDGFGRRQMNREYTRRGW
jgi:hypothetical protein